MEIDAEEYIQLTQIGPAQEPLNVVLDTVLSVLAQVLVAAFSFYSTALFYVRQALYFFQRQLIYSNRTPQLVRKDLAGLAKVPQHVAFVLEKPAHNGLETLINEAVETVIWCLGAGSPQLTIYERTGALKALEADSFATAVSTALAKYFNPEDAPIISIRKGEHTVVSAGSSEFAEKPPSLQITLASEQDGRPMLVSLTRDYACSIADGTLKKSDITVDRVHQDLCRRVGDEPDLLVTFGSYLDFAGFSPWLLRVTELFCLPDNNGVFHYLVFFRALHKFSNVKVNLGA